MTAAPVVQPWKALTIDGEVPVCDFVKHLESADHMQRCLADAERRCRKAESQCGYLYGIILILAVWLLCAMAGVWR